MNTKLLQPEINIIYIYGSVTDNYDTGDLWNGAFIKYANPIDFFD